MIFIYNLDEQDQEPLWLLAICFIFGAINLHLDVDILEFILEADEDGNKTIDADEFNFKCDFF